MLNLDANLESIVNLAIDVAGLATKYDFTVMRWGTSTGASCTVQHDLSDTHDTWSAMDVELADEQKIPQFVTDCVIAGLHCFRRGTFVHVQTAPIQQISFPSEVA